ncbi:MAG: 3-dehydroquinate synthase [Planctomycetota bacterium]|nr:3-dehydroquinate synthase [Planctomycetota bacterium]
METPQTIPVHLGPRSYTVSVGAALLETLGRTVAQVPHVRQAVIVADSAVARLYGERARASLAAAGIDARLLEFPPGESSKTAATWLSLQDGLLAGARPIDRRTVVVGLGGGVTTDLAGFAAATCLRGLAWVACPTTLLAAVDASVGGKTGVDHPAGKNLIGAFHQPSAVVIDVDTFASLPAGQLANGLAECVKHAVIREAGLLDFIDAGAGAIAACDRGLLTELVARNVAIKAAVVAADEIEAGERAHLNFGHTIGHAVETYLGYETIGHGEAVSLGMVAANHVAARRGILPAAIAARVEAVLAKLTLPVRRAGLAANVIWEIMQHDKKAREGKVRMVLARGFGKVEIVDDVKEKEVRDAVKYLGR